MKIINTYQEDHFFKIVPTVQIEATWWEMWKFKRAYNKLLKKGDVVIP